MDYENLRLRVEYAVCMLTQTNPEQVRPV